MNLNQSPNQEKTLKFPVIQELPITENSNPHLQENQRILNKPETESHSKIKKSQENKIKERKQSFKEEYKKGLDELLPKSGNYQITNIEKDGNAFVDSSKNKVRIIAVCGGAASGKTFIVKSIRNYLRTIGYNPTTIKERNFLLKIPIKDEDLTPEIIKNYDFDHYNAIDWKLFENSIKSLLENKPFNCPVYSLFDDRPTIITKKLKPSNVILIEGRLFLNNKTIREQSHFKIYLDTDSDIMLSRIIIKNEKLKCLPLEDVIHKYTKFIKPNFQKYVEVSKKYADMIIFNFAGEYMNPDEQRKEFEFLNMIKDWLNYKITNSE